jgi:hypothetical protein
VTAARGMYRAKGDVWGTLTGNTFKPSSANLLTRTARMARAVQVYLQRQGYEDAGVVEAALLCADPGLHVDSVRPVVRVVQSDALERFAVSVAQARVTLSPEAVAEITDRILTPRPAKAAEPAAPAPVAPAPEEDPYVPAFALPVGEPPQPAAPPVQAGDLGFDFKEGAAPKDETPYGAQPVPQSAALRPGSGQARPPVRKRRGFSAKQWILLAVFAVFECIVLFVFLYLASQNL